MYFCIKVQKPLATTIFQVFLMSSKGMNKLKMQINIFDYWKNIKKNTCSKYNSMCEYMILKYE